MTGPASSPATSAGTRAERRREQVRREILEAAFECFAEQGYHHTGIADIAARLGMGHGTFYRYFANKRDIVDHVITDVIDRILQALSAENAAGAAATLADYEAQSERIGRALARILGEDPRLARLLLFDAPAVDDALRERVLDFLETAVTLTGGYLAHGIAAGYLRADLDVEATARGINGMILGTVIAAQRDPAAASQDRMSRAVRRLMYDGIAARG